MTRSLSTGDLRSLWTLRRAMADSDVVFLHSSKAGALGRIATLSLPRRRSLLVFYPHAWSWEVGGKGAAVYRATEHLLAPVADRIVAVSGAEERRGRVVLGPRGRSRIEVIENGVDVDRFVAQGPCAALGSAPSVVCVGRLCDQKGQDLLVASMRDPRLADVSLFLVGDGPRADLLRAQARDAGIDDRVHLVGHADPRPYYRAADLVVLPSRWEGFSLVTLEAMACGANVLASPAAAADLGEDQGIFVIDAPDDPTGIATSIADALDVASGTDEFRRRARDVAVESFSLRRVEERYDRMLAALVAARPRGLAS